MNERTFIDLMERDVPKAMEYLYDEYSGVLYGVISRILDDEKAAGEALKETFVEVKRGYPTFGKGNKTIRTSIICIARKCAAEKRKMMPETESNGFSYLNVHGQCKLIDKIFAGNDLSALADHNKCREEELKKVLHNEVRELSGGREIKINNEFRTAY